MASRKVLLAGCQNRFCQSHLLKRLLGSPSPIARSFHSEMLPDCRFGFMFDIDGVIVRGRKLLPSAQEAFQLLTDEQGHFQVPALFVTNAGNSLRCNKAKQLSEWLGIKVQEEQVVMSHSPLKMFQQFHDKHVLINGQGPIKEIAHNLGFTHVTTVEELSAAFPHLDVMDHGRRRAAPCAFEEYFPPIEAVVLMGEPVRWEMPLQILLDVLMSNGKPNVSPTCPPYPHVPVLACNMDLLWMAEAPTPRFGHGCFLHALEGLYQKITGRQLKYTALVGKPSDITYHHADYLLHLQAKTLGIDGIKTIYCIGDNPETDIYGGNLYNQYLQKRAQQRREEKMTAAARAALAKTQKKRPLPQSEKEHVWEEDDDDDDDGSGNRIRIPVISSPSEGDEETAEGVVGDVARQVTVATEDQDEGGASGLYTENCESILVCTGVFSEDMDLFSLQTQRPSSHNHRDFVINPDLKVPTHTVRNVFEAVKLVMKKEGANIRDHHAKNVEN